MPWYGHFKVDYAFTVDKVAMQLFISALNNHKTLNKAKVVLSVKAYLTRIRHLSTFKETVKNRATEEGEKITLSQSETWECELHQQLLWERRLSPDLHTVPQSSISTQNPSQ